MMVNSKKVFDWNGNVVSSKDSMKTLTKMKNRANEITDEPVGEYLSKDQYSNLMQIRTYTRQLKMQTKLANLESQIREAEKANLPPAELIVKLSDIESEIESILSMARSSKPDNGYKNKSAQPT
jgi:hypothetical protein